MKPFEWKHTNVKMCMHTRPLPLLMPRPVQMEYVFCAIVSIDRTRERVRYAHCAQSHLLLSFILYSDLPFFFAFRCVNFCAQSFSHLILQSYIHCTQLCNQLFYDVLLVSCKSFVLSNGTINNESIDNAQRFSMPLNGNMQRYM